MSAAERLVAAAMMVPGVTRATVHADHWSPGDLLVEVAVNGRAWLDSGVADEVRRAVEAAAAEVEPRPVVRLGGVMGTL